MFILKLSFRKYHVRQTWLLQQSYWFKNPTLNPHPPYLLKPTPLHPTHPLTPVCTIVTINSSEVACSFFINKLAEVTQFKDIKNQPGKNEKCKKHHNKCKCDVMMYGNVNNKWWQMECPFWKESIYYNENA